MSDRDECETVLARNQLGRQSIRPSSFRKTFNADSSQRRVTQLGSGGTDSKGSSPCSTSSPSTPEGLKQWELVEGDAGLKVVEKKKGNSNSNSRANSASGSPVLNASPHIRARARPLFVNEETQNSIVSQNIQDFENVLANKFRGFERPGNNDKISPSHGIKLDTILNRNTMDDESSIQTSIGIKNSTDMLDQLERQVKAIEQGTIAAAARLQENNNNHRDGNVGSDKIDNEVELRYREHEDLLRNNTDDEAEG